MFCMRPACDDGVNELELKCRTRDGWRLHIRRWTYEESKMKEDGTSARNILSHAVMSGHACSHVDLHAIWDVNGVWFAKQFVLVLRGKNWNIGEDISFPTH